MLQVSRAVVQDRVGVDHELTSGKDRCLYFHCNKWSFSVAIACNYISKIRECGMMPIFN